MYCRLLFFILILFIRNELFSQDLYPTSYFGSPIDGTLTLSGNFGEIRPNHFHAGFDIRTSNKEGKPVYAAAEGFVSRIKIGPVGYGKALYITHPNGYTTVYAHLKRFNTKIQDFITEMQYKNESFEIDTLLPPELFPVQKAELIALSGNSGSSESPHLHFEVRDTKTENPINPYFFGYKVADTIKPRITQVVAYPLGNNATINGRHHAKKIVPVYSKGKYSYLKTDTLNVNGEIGFGIECYDTELGSAGKNGVFSVELQSGGKRIFYYEFEKFSFENSRYVNAHIDYENKQKHNSKIQKCFLSKNNQAGLYKMAINNGIVNFTDDSVHWIRFIVKDFVNNTTELMLKVKSNSRKKIAMEKTSVKTMDCLKDNKYESEEIQIFIPAYALYDDIAFNYLKSPALKGTCSFLHHVQNDQTALHKAITISIKSNPVPEALQHKACIISVDKKGKRIYEKGEYKNGWVTTHTKTFGTFAITTDTLAPKLNPIFKIAGKNTVDLRKYNRISIIAKDDLSGIKKYRATIDGKWVLCEYDAKKNLLFYTFDEKIKTGNHIFNIEVTDEKENKNSLMFNFIR